MTYGEERLYWQFKSLRNIWQWFKLKKNLVVLMPTVMFQNWAVKTGIKAALSSLRQFLAIESPLKMMKNAFYFTLKARQVLKIFNFLSWICANVEKELYQKDKVIFKIYGITTWLPNIAIPILTNISRSKDNQAVTFGQLEYNLRNIFLD